MDHEFKKVEAKAKVKVRGNSPWTMVHGLWTDSFNTPVPVKSPIFAAPEANPL
jgi:hypothetical protein